MIEFVFNPFKANLDIVNTAVVRYNSTTNVPEFYNGSEWIPLCICESSVSPSSSPSSSISGSPSSSPSTSPSSSPSASVSGFPEYAILTEDGDYLITEDGDYLIYQ